MLCLAPYYFRVCLAFNSWFAFLNGRCALRVLQHLACFPLVISSTDICSNLHTKLFRGQAREGEGKERDTLSYPGFMLHPRLPNLQQLFLKRNHRTSTSRNTSSLSYPDIVLYFPPFLRIILYPARAPLLARGVVASYCAVLTCTQITRAFRRHILQRNTTFAGGNCFLFCQLTAGEI